MNILKSGIHDALVDSKKPILIVYERDKIRIDMKGKDGRGKGVDSPYLKFAYSIVGKGG